MSPRSLIDLYFITALIIGESFKINHGYCTVVKNKLSSKTSQKFLVMLNWNIGSSSSLIHAKWTVNFKGAIISPLITWRLMATYLACRHFLWCKFQVDWFPHFDITNGSKLASPANPCRQGRKCLPRRVVFALLKWKPSRCQPSSKAYAGSYTNLGTVFPQCYLRPHYLK